MITKVKHVCSDGLTHRIHFRVNVESSAAEIENVNVEKVLWQALEHTNIVSIRLMPSEPNISKLLVGQREDDAPPQDSRRRLPAGGIC